MARLLYSMIASLDGRVADADGRFDWARPDDELHRFIDDQERSVGTYLYGRRMYEVMRFWEDVGEGLPGPEREYAGIWRAAEKVVYSTTLDPPTAPRTRLERSFDPAAVRALVTSADRDVSVAGPGLAARALGAGLVDECWAYVVPVLVGSGPRLFPEGVRRELELLEERRFTGGAVLLRHRVVR